MTETLDLRTARGKLKSLCDALKGTVIFGDGLTSYHAAREAINGTKRVGAERRFNAVRKALKGHRVMVAMHTIDDLPCVRIHIPGKRLDVIL